MRDLSPWLRFGLVLLGALVAISVTVCLLWVASLLFGVN